MCAVGVASGTRAGQPCKFVDSACSEGAVIYRQGESARHAWYIKSGTVVLRRSTYGNEGESAPVRAIRFQGNFIGLELLVDDCYQDTAVAGSDAVLCGVPEGRLEEWIGPRNHPARTALEVALRSEATQLTRVRRRDGSAIQRAAAWLIDEDPSKRSVALQRRELADLLNMRAETLSRVLARLGAMGAVAVGRSYVEITDANKLKAVATGESG